MITNFPGFPNLMGLAAISHVMRNWWEIPCIFQMMEYNHRMWIYWEKINHTIGKLWVPFSCVFHHAIDFVVFLLCYEKLGWKPINSPYDEVCHRVESNEKNHLYYGKIMGQISQGFAIQWVLLPFPILWDIDDRTYPYPIWWSSVSHNGNLMDQETPIACNLYGNHILRLFSIWSV